MKYFKIKTGYGKNEFVSIDETELETALHVFMEDSKGIFKNGVVRGKDIISITEDYHKHMGWNYAHEMETDDWEDLRSKNILNEYRGVIEEAKNTVKYLTETKQTHLIGKNYRIPKIETPNKSYSQEIIDIANKFRI